MVYVLGHLLNLSVSSLSDRPVPSLMLTSADIRGILLILQPRLCSITSPPRTQEMSLVVAVAQCPGPYNAARKGLCSLLRPPPEGPGQDQNTGLLQDCR